MRIVTLSNAEKNLRALIHEVRKNSEPAVIVDRDSAEQAVLISIDDYRAMEETAYLLRTPANRAHLEEALQQVKENETVAFPSEELGISGLRRPRGEISSGSSSTKNIRRCVLENC